MGSGTNTFTQYGIDKGQTGGVVLIAAFCAFSRP